MHAIVKSSRLALLGSLAVACGGSPDARDAEKPAAVQVTHAQFAPSGADDDQARATGVAELQRIGKRSRPAGKLEIEQTGNLVTLRGEFRNLPSGVRGLQIHEQGHCGEIAARRSGDHFNPTDAPHGPPESSKRHVGDLGNIHVSKEGTARFEMKTDSLTATEGGPSSVLKRSVVITSRKDDGKTQPDGNAGPAVACGVIRSQ